MTEKKLASEHIETFERFIDVSSAESVPVKSLISAFEAIGAEVAPMEYQEGYEIDVRENGKTIRNVACFYKAKSAPSDDSKVMTVKKPKQDDSKGEETIKFVQRVLAENRAP